MTTAQHLTKKDTSGIIQQTGWSPAQDWGVPWMVAYWQQGGALLNADETQATFANTQGETALGFLKKVYDAEGSYTDVTKAMTDLGGARKAFLAGKVAMHWDTHSTIHDIDVAKVNYQWGATYFPLPPGGKHANYMGGWSLVIPKGAKQAAGAFQYLEFLCTAGPQVAWSDAWNTVPPVIDVAKSAAYIKGDPLRQLAVDEMPGAKWVIATPGGDQIITVEVGIMGNVLSGKQSAQDALAAANDQVQTLLDNALKSAAVK